MTMTRAKHLSEEAFDDVLIGMGSDESVVHLARCAACRAKLEAFRTDIRLLNEASLAWSEARPKRSLRLTPQRPTGRMPLTLLGSTAAAVLVAAIAIPMWRHEHTSVAKDTVNVTVNAVERQDSQEQIAADNELMKEVSAAVDPGEENPVAEYNILESPTAH